MPEDHAPESQVAVQPKLNKSLLARAPTFLFSSSHEFGEFPSHNLSPSDALSSHPELKNKVPKDCLRKYICLAGIQSASIHPDSNSLQTLDRFHCLLSDYFHCLYSSVWGSDVHLPTNVLSPEITHYLWIISPNDFLQERECQSPCNTS